METVRGDVGRFRRPRLDALSGIRIVAAIHIYLFHLKQAHDAGVLTFRAFDSLPAPLARLLSRGCVSTGFFFVLSGFLLAYAYLDSNGQPKVRDRSFWKGRFRRLYPLYFLSLLLLIPAPALLPITPKQLSIAETISGMVTSLTLTQAWFPAFALFWNAPAWALSAFAAFYAVFPLFARRIARLRPGELVTVVIGLAFASWLPMALYVLTNPYGDAYTATAITRGGFWLNLLRFNPLSWLPQFLAGVALGRLFMQGVDSGRVTVESKPSWRVSAGDVTAIATLAISMFVPAIPYVPLRHGLLTPAFLGIVWDLGRGRGILAHIVSGRMFCRLSEASFGLFALQMPVGVWFMFLTLVGPRGTSLHLMGMIAATLGASIAWAELVQRPRRAEKGPDAKSLRRTRRANGATAKKESAQTV